MKLSSKQIQLHYDGFLQTPFLWENDSILDLHQFEIETQSSKIDIDINPKLRLGKYIERFVSHQLSKEKSITILAENIQIQLHKRTLGELDCIILKNNKPVHLEIIYKFYLYDDAVGTTEIAHFIGPNRKDSLVEKLTKLKEKQLPLLFSDECKAYLKKLNLSSSNIKQNVYFKAKLFLPFAKQNIKLSKLNQDCIVGFYINQQELQQFNDCKFYIPNKKDWLLIPHQNVNWICFNDFKTLASENINREYSPLLWIKNPKGIISKIFLVWW